MNKDYKSLSDEQLIEEYSRLFSNHMYYMAAEGNWAAEAEDRRANEKEYYACEDEMKARGLFK